MYYVLTIKNALINVAVVIAMLVQQQKAVETPTHTSIILPVDRCAIVVNGNVTMAMRV